MENTDWEPRQISEYTDTEKIAAFDKLHKQALAQYNQVKKDKYADEDGPHYLFEVLMGILARPGEQFWPHYNKLTK